MLFICPTGTITVAGDLIVAVDIDLRCFDPVAVLEVYDDIGMVRFWKSVFMNAGPARRGHFSFDMALIEQHTIISRRSALMCMGKVRSVVFLPKFDLSGGRDDQYITIVGTTCAAEVGMRETVDHGIGIMVARTAIPSMEARIRAKLHHAKRHYRTREGMAVATGAYEGICILGIVLRPSLQAKGTNK